MDDRYSREQGDVNNTPLREKYQTKHFSAETHALIEEDTCLFIRQSMSTPVLNIIEHSQGAYLYDLQGRRYLDLHGNGVHNVGFNNPYVIQRVIECLKQKKTFTPRRFSNAEIIELARKLVEVSPEGLDKVLFAPGGSQAIEMAVMLAKQVTGKWKTISFWDSYHGTGFQAASVSGEAVFKKRNGPMVPGAFHVDVPRLKNNPWGFTSEEQVEDEILRQVRKIIEVEGEIACFVAEPISATPVIVRKEFWEKIRTLCDQHNIVLIFDEVIEGFGRTGRMFACEHFITPDILVFGKSLGAGLVPFAGLIAHERFDRVPDVSVGHYTHEKNGLCGAIGVSVIDYILEHRLVENAEVMGRYFLEQLEALSGKHPILEDFVGLGLHLGITLSALGEYSAEELAEEAMYLALEQGVSFKIIEGKVITMRPSLIVGTPEIDTIVSVLDTVFSHLENKLNTHI